jgi:hypothetical protein
MDRLPNLLVIGAMKCGTSALHRLLDQHPEISMSRLKEPNFFLPADAERAGGPGGLLGERSTAARGLEWYEGQFGSAPVRGESSVAYSFPWFDGVADAVADALAAPRLIYLVRDPVERMLSHRDQFAARDRRPLARALPDPEGPYLQASSYATALAPFIERFGRERLLVLEQSGLRQEPESVLAETFSFLGVDPGFRPLQGKAEANVSGGKGGAYRLAERVRSSGPGAAVAERLPRSWRAGVERRLRVRGSGQPRPEVDRELRARLLQLLEPEIAGLERLTGWDLRRWRDPSPG